MENIEDAKQAATEAFEEAQEAATEAGLAAFEDVKAGLITKVQEAIAKFGDFIKEKIQGLLARKSSQLFAKSKILLRMPGTSSR